MTLSEREQALNDLLDREAIRELPVRYCHCVRTRNLPAMLDLWAEEGGFEMPASVSISSKQGGVWRGKAALTDVFRNGFERSDPWPFVHNHIVDLQGPDRATGFVYVELRVTAQKMRTAQIVVYEDEYVKEGGRWRFKFRKLNGIPIPE